MAKTPPLIAWEPCPDTYCACNSCDEFILNNKNKFIFGHHKRLEIGEKNSFFGKTHSNTTKETIRNFNLGKKQSNETKLKKSNALKGRTRPLEESRKAGDSNRGKKRSEETRKKNSLVGKRNWAEGKFDNRIEVDFFKGIKTSYKGILFRSKFESRVAKLMDFYGIKWVYEPKRFKILSDNTTYLPDFYLPEFDIWLECKWTNDMKEYPELWKVDIFRNMGHYISVVTEKEIKNIEQIVQTQSKYNDLFTWVGP